MVSSKGARVCKISRKTPVKPISNLKDTPNLRGATFAKFGFFDQIKVNYLNLHFLQKISQHVKKRASY